MRFCDVLAAAAAAAKVCRTASGKCGVDGGAAIAGRWHSHVARGSMLPIAIGLSSDPQLTSGWHCALLRKVARAINGLIEANEVVPVPSTASVQFTALLEIVCLPSGGTDDSSLNGGQRGQQGYYLHTLYLLALTTRGNLHAAA